MSLINFGAGVGDWKTSRTPCPCGKGEIVDDHCDAPGFRSHDIDIYCDICKEKYEIDTTNGNSSWKLKEKSSFQQH